MEILLHKLHSRFLQYLVSPKNEQIPGHGHAPSHGHGHGHGDDSNAGGGIIIAD